MQILEECPKCGAEVYEESVLIDRTNSPYEEDKFIKALICEDERCNFISY